jgi:hypothetical protein
MWGILFEEGPNTFKRFRQPIREGAFAFQLPSKVAFTLGGHSEQSALFMKFKLDFSCVCSHVVIARVKR